LLTLVDQPNAAVAEGRVFINTGMLLQCHSPSQIPAILAHRVGYIMCDHVIEMQTARLFWRFLAWFDRRFNDELELRGVQETEADRIGLLIVTTARFDSQSTIDALSDRMAWEGR
jgi:predicted Zn-dependent protease